MAKTKTFRVPDLTNATPEFLVDELGSLRDQIKELAKQEKMIKTALLARSEGVSTINGDRYSAQINDQVQERFDQEGTRAEMGEEWWSEHLKTIEFKVVKTAKLNGS